MAFPGAQLGAVGLPVAGPFSGTFLGRLRWTPVVFLFIPSTVAILLLCFLLLCVCDPGQPGGHKHLPPKSGLRVCLPAAPSFLKYPLGTWVGSPG